MKKLCAAILCLLLVFSVSTAVIAEEYSTMTIDPISDVYISADDIVNGLTFNVSGYVEFDNAGSNQGSIVKVTMVIRLNGEPYFFDENGIEFEFEETFGSDKDAEEIRDGLIGKNFLFEDLEVKDFGEYSIEVTTLFTGNNNTYPSSTEIITFEVFEEIVEIEYLAAPAVATELLKEAGVSHRYGKNGNYISDVAQAMENEAVFQGVEKSDVEAYREAVEAFLTELGAL